MLWTSPRWNGCLWCRRVRAGPSTPAMTFHAGLPGHPKSSLSWAECGANLGKPKRCGETGQEGVRVGAVSWPGTQTSDTVPHPTFPLPPDKNGLRHEAFPTEQPPQLGGISLSINHPTDTHPLSFLGGGGSWDPAAHQTLPFLALPLFLDFYPFSPARQSSPFPRTHRGRQQLLPGRLTGDLRGNTSSLHLCNMLQSQNRPQNPALGTPAALQAAQVRTYNRSQAFDNFIKHQG